MPRIKLWAYDGVLTSSVAGPIDILAVANTVWSRQSRDVPKSASLFEWRIESPNGQPIRSASGQMLAVDGPIGSRTAADAVIVLGAFVGGGSTRFLEVFDASRAQREPLSAALRREHVRGAVVASVCAGAFVLAESGLLDGRVATTHWALADAFRQRFPKVDLRADEVLTEQQRLLCSGAVTSYFNLSLRLVERFAGSSIASLVAKLLLIDTSRISQASYRTLTVQDRQPHCDPLVQQAQRWMERHFNESFRLGDLANRLAVSERTLIRRFNAAIRETPLAHMQTLRIDAAKRLLETSRLSVEMIGERVGYGDLSTFRRLFKRETGLSPRDYQQRFSRRNGGYVRSGN